MDSNLSGSPPDPSKVQPPSSPSGGGRNSDGGAIGGEKPAVSPSPDNHRAPMGSTPKYQHKAMNPHRHQNISIGSMPNYQQYYPMGSMHPAMQQYHDFSFANDGSQFSHQQYFHHPAFAVPFSHVGPYYASPAYYHGPGNFNGKYFGPSDGRSFPFFRNDGTHYGPSVGNDDSYHGRSTDRQRVFVNNIPFCATPKELLDLFETCGNVLDMYMPLYNQFGNRGFAFVTLSKENATKAITNLNGYELYGRNIRVCEANDKPPRRANAKKPRSKVVQDAK